MKHKASLALVLCMALGLTACSSGAGGQTSTKPQTPNPTVFKPTLQGNLGNPRDIPPPESTWNYKVETSPTSIYYAKSAEQTKEGWVLKGYWEFKEGQWVWTDFTLYAGHGDQFRAVKVTAKKDIKEDPTKENAYYWAPTPRDMNKIARLKTVQLWEGTESKAFSFKASKSPWVVNAAAYATSSIKSGFKVEIVVQTASGLHLSKGSEHSSRGLQAIVMDNSGSYTIQVQSTGAKWWVKAGVEP